MNTYSLFNNAIEDELVIGSSGAKLLRQIYGGMEPHPLNEQTKDFLEELKEMGFLYESDEPYVQDECVHIGSRCKYKHPLTSVSIELTNVCNFKCKHCYGAFPDSEAPEFIPFEWIKASLPALNALNVNQIAITGGEPTLHPDFIEIAMFMLEHGFDVCIFTNGYNYDVITELLERSRQYRYEIKISIDGISSTHDAIRGRSGAYEHAMKCAEEVSKFENVTLFISTVVMQDNIASMKEFDECVKTNLPNAIHMKDMVFPMGCASGFGYTLEQIPEIWKKMPELFTREKSREEKVSRNQLRCNGGEAQCTIMTNGRMKICNAACDERFYFKYNAFDVGLEYAWVHCGSNIEAFRKEKRHSSKECRKCDLRDQCTTTDCRIKAWVYRGDHTRCNPLACLVAGKEI